MSISSPKTILDRIRAATSASPIAVFRTENGQLEAVFASTVVTQQALATSDGPRLVGIYDKSLDRSRIASELHDALGVSGG